MTTQSASTKRYSDQGEGIAFLASQLSDGEKDRLLDGRQDWRDADWQDHCGNPLCESCTGYADASSNTLSAEHDPEGFALSAYLNTHSETGA